MVIQKAMGWGGAHLHEFEVRGHRYGVPAPDEPEYEVEPDRGIALRDAVPAVGDTFQYVYDLGDHWVHDVVVERIDTPAQPLRYSVCLAGERRCPPDDCGGAGGYEALLDALRDPDHPDHEDMRRWVGRRFDPAVFDIAAVSRTMRRLK